MKRKPDKRTVAGVAISIREWCLLGLSDAIPCTISKKYDAPRLREALVYVVGPGESYLKQARVINQILTIKNKTLMVRVVWMKHKSKKYKVGEILEIKPKYLIPIF